MRKLISLYAISWLLLAAGPSVKLASAADNSNRLFRAGAATADITPEINVSLNGTISKPGPVKGVHDRLHARAIVLDDGTTRLALVVTDLTMIERAVCDQVKARIENDTNLPSENVLISAVHTHAAPRVRHGRVGPLDDDYYEFLTKQIVGSVKQAIAHLAPARIGWGSCQQPKYLRCRRSLCWPDTVGPNPFGERGELVKSVAGQGGKVVKPAGPVDPELFVVSIQHTDGRPLAVLANYSVHYCGGYARGLVSADYFGYFARRLEDQSPTGNQHPVMVGVMTNGTSGNTGSIQSGGENHPPFEWMQISGEELADRALEVIQTIDYRDNLSLSMADTDLQLGIRRPTQQRVAWARDVLAHPKTKQPHPWTKVFAEQTVLLSRYPEHRPVKLQVIRIGDLAIAAVACEVFAETGLAIKRDSPFQSTFTISLANGSEGYLPPPLQHQWGGYETWPATSSCLEVEAEPKIRQSLQQMLDQAHARR